MSDSNKAASPADPRERESGENPTVHSNRPYYSTFSPKSNRPAAIPSDRLLDPEEPRFVEGAPISTGGMGAVREAFDSLMLRNVALKTVHSTGQDDPERLVRFIEEAQITGQIDHPGVVPVYDLRLDDGELTLVMKLVRGVTLTRIFEDIHAKPLEQRDIRRVCRMLIQICEAVSFAHSRGVIHRDLKPDNIMVGQHGELYVMDWGIALVKAGGSGHVRLVDDATRKSEFGIVGTLAFMAPEQARGTLLEIEERTDVYGIGGVLYYFLTGRAPHTASAPQDVLKLAQAGKVAPIGECAIWPNFPPGLARIAMKALAPQPADRYPNVDALRADLEQFLDGGGWFQTHLFSPGEAIVVEGEPADSAYIIVDGECEVYKTIGGTRTLLRRMGPGEVFGETAVLTRRSRSATVVASTTVNVKVVTRDSLERELERNPWMGAFLRALAERFLELDDMRRADAPASHQK